MRKKEKITYKTFKDEDVENFLNGRKSNNQKYIVAIEGSSNSNEVRLFVDDPETKTKYIKNDEYRPFIYVKDFKSLNIPFYSNRKDEMKENMKKYHISFKKLKTTDINGATVDRLENGYKYIFYTDSVYGMRSLRNFFNEGGIDIYWKTIESIKSDLFTPNPDSKKPFIYDDNDDRILYNNISQNYEIIIRDINRVVYNSIVIKYTGDFKKEEVVLDEDGEDEDEDENVKKPLKKVDKGDKEVLKKLKLFINYDIFYDESEKVYRIIFKDKLKEGEKIDITYELSNRDFFFTLKPEEQYLIQKSLRLFNGFKTYDDIHKFVFDIETTGLNPDKDRIFAIGCKDNRKFKSIDFVNDMNDEEEKRVILNFFKHITRLKPSVIFGYNSEDFDFHFILRRAELIGLDIETIQTTYLTSKSIARLFNTSLKVGNETKYFTKTKMYGFNVLDIIHAVWKTQAINSNIKETGLKYIANFAGISKPNRMYIKNGAKIYQMWKEDKFYINKSQTNDYELIPDEYQKNVLEYLKMNPDYDEIITGKEIVEKYLEDDLWETLEVDKVYNESTFMLSKYLPTGLERTATIGGASSWNLIMTAWSYEKDLAIPCLPHKKDFTGGLSRTFKVGYFENIYKEDYAGLYPAIQLEHYVFPKHDISFILFRLLSYFKFTRDKYKKLGKDETLPELERKFYDALQLPIKILNNSNFGALGSEYFNWADFDCAERITCTGRLYLRRMIDYFMKFGAIPITEDSVTGDTPVYIKYEDGVIDIVPISSLFNNNSRFLDEEKLRDYSPKKYDILTRGGWKKIKYVYKHKTNKNIHTITTKDRRIDVTEDHSLFQDSIEVKPKDLIKNDKIDIFDLTKLDFNYKEECIYPLNEEIAWLYGMFLGDGSALSSKRNKRYFSKRRNEYIVYNHEGRNDWKISNQNIEFLEKSKNILKEYFNIDGLIKDHTKSSNVYNLVAYGKDFVKFFANNFYTKDREKKIPSFILNCNDLNVLKSFIEGFIDAEGYPKGYDTCLSIDQKPKTALAGLSLILGKLNKEYRIYLRKDKEHITKFAFPQNNKRKTHSIMKSNLVYNNRINETKFDFVYDVSTEDGTFIAGIGGVICHNTDGCNFSVPEYVNIDLNFNELDTPIKIDDLTYEYEGVTYKGIDAMVEKYNNDIIGGQYMKLDNDGMWISAANFSRKNYANLEYSTLEDKNKKKIFNIPKQYLDNEKQYLEIYINENSYTEEQAKNIKIKKSKPKVTGNTIKSKTMSEYIEEFINNAMKLILTNKPKEFIDYYYEYLTKIYCKQIPIKKIASKSRLKQSVQDYINRGTDVNGRAKAKQAHMELIIANNINTSGMDFIYYVNNGTAKSHGDVSFNKKTGKFNSYIITENEIKNNPDMLGEYNVARYVNNFNKRVKSLLTIFPEKIQKTIIKNQPMGREYYTEDEMKLVNFDKDSIEDFFYLEEKEVKFWNRTGLRPQDIFKDFKTDFEIKSQEYYDKYKEVKTKMLQLGLTNKLKMQHQYHKNDDIVLLMKKTYHINNQPVDDMFSKYLEKENVYLPLSDYKEIYKLYALNNNKNIIITEKNNFFIAKVKQGIPQIIKEV